MAQTVRLRAVAWVIANNAAILAFMLLPPAMLAGWTGQAQLALALAGVGVICGVVSASAPSDAAPGDLRLSEAMIGVALVFLLAALSAVPAFMTLGMSPVASLFEAMSAVTTTGLSVARDPDAWPFAAHFLRAWMQWVGGLIMATAVLALILPTGVPLLRLGRATIDQGDRVASTKAQARQLLGAYAGITVLAAAVIAAVHDDMAEAGVLALSAISTGGFAPRSDSLASYDLATQVAVLFGCVLGAVSMLVYILLAQRKWMQAWSIGSIQRVGLVLAIMGMIGAAFAVASGMTGAEAVRIVLNLVSAMTTAGYSVAPLPTGGALLLVFVAIMVLGADNGSTGGGLKLSRVAFALKTVRHVLRLPFLPDRAVFPMKSRGDRVRATALVSLLALMVIYGIAVFGVVLHFVLHGYPLGPSLFDAVSALSTVGLSSGVVGPDLPVDLKLTVTFAMWLGRLEFIAVLLLFLPKTWGMRE